jgi:5-bromo-4-chloroindolyl phosphate hydrolysis protein
MADPSRKGQLERRLEQSRRLLKTVCDPITKERIEILIDDLEKEEKREAEK